MASSLVIRYAVFAVAAAAANLLAQRSVLVLDRSTLGLVSAVAVGTGVGLVVKYLLDKRWIFYDPSAGLRTHGRKFTLYTVTGLFTTLIFWGSEATFWMLWRTDAMREIGAVLGLTIGYVIKYRLDQRFVFGKRVPRGAVT